MKVAKLLNHRRVIALAAANCALFGFLIHLTIQPVRLPALPKSPLDNAITIQLPSGTSTPTNDADNLYAALTGQPLFHQDRHLVPEQPETAVPQTPPPAYLLTGYLELPGRPGRAFLYPASGGHTLIVGLGDNVEGWSVVGINARRVELKQGDRTVGIGKDGDDAVPNGDDGSNPPHSAGGPGGSLHLDNLSAPISNTPTMALPDTATGSSKSMNGTDAGVALSVPARTMPPASSGRLPTNPAVTPPILVAPRSLPHTYLAPRPTRAHQP